MWNDAEAFCEPYVPYRVRSALHFSGSGKRIIRYRIQRTHGRAFETIIRYGARPTAAAVAA